MLKISVSEAAAALQSADEALRTAGPFLTKITRRLLLEDAQSCPCDEAGDADTDELSEGRSIALNTIAAACTVAFEGPLTTMMAIFPSFSGDENKASSTEKLEEKEAPFRLKDGHAEEVDFSRNSASTSSKKSTRMAKAHRLMMDAGVPCPDFAEDGAAWSFDALAAVWRSSSWLRHVVLPVLVQHIRAQESQQEPTANASAQAPGAEQFSGDCIDPVIVSELEVWVDDVFSLHRSAQVPWNDLNINLLRSHVMSAWALIEALRPLADPKDITDGLQRKGEAQAPSHEESGSPRELVLRGEEMHRLFVQLAIMTMDELLVPEVKLAVTRGLLPVPDVLMSNKERKEEIAKLQAVEAALEAASRAWRDVFVDVPPPPVALHDLPTLLTYLERILEKRPGQVKATNVFRSLHRCLGRTTDSVATGDCRDSSKESEVLQLCRDACECFGCCRHEPLTAHRAAELLGAFQKLLLAFENNPRCAEAAEQLGLWSRKLDSVFKLDEVQVTIQDSDQ